MKTQLLKVLTVAMLFLMSNVNYGQIAPDLNSAADFGILAGTAISFNGVASVINDMDVGLSPGFRSSITGVPPSSVVNGAIYAADDAPPVPAMLLQAKLDLTNAYLFAAGASAPAPVTVSGDQGGTTLYAGIYKSTSTLLIQSGDLTLDAQGDADAVWIFQIASDFTTIGGGPFPSGSGGNVILTGGALADNVFWQVGSSATIGDYTDFYGNVLALTSITMNSYARIEGRLLARNGAVTFAGGSTMNRPFEPPPSIPISTWALVLGGALIAIGVFVSYRRII
ncbi:MAG: ice-binding family protein [Syntrophales bacterium]